MYGDVLRYSLWTQLILEINVNAMVHFILFLACIFNVPIHVFESGRIMRSE